MNLYQSPYTIFFTLLLVTASFAIHDGAFNDIPSFVPREFDCRLRQFALSFAEQLAVQQHQRDHCELFHALRVGTKCNITCSTHTAQRRKKQTTAPLRSSKQPLSRIYVDAHFGRDENPGTKKEPVRSLARGIEALREFKTQNRDLILFSGTYVLKQALVLRPEDSFVRIRGIEGGSVEVTGCKPLQGLVWESVRASDTVHVWAARVSEADQIQALRFNGKRVERARTPNGRVEEGSFHAGWFPAAERWLPRELPRTKPISVRSRLNRSTYIRTFSSYTTGIGGVCNKNFVPNVSFWCNPRNPRDGAGGVWAAPRGLVWEKHSLGLGKTLFNGTLVGAVVHAWHKQRWSTQQYRVSRSDLSSRTLQWEVGGFQDARASSTGSAYYIDNALPLLDAPMEFFHDNLTRRIYLGWDIALGPPPDSGFCSAGTSSLVKVIGNGSSLVENVTLQGLAFTHTAPTFFEPHGVPSGGDWALQRQAAVFAEGTSFLSIHDCSFERIDGNALMLSKYNRHAVIQRNRFRWIGATAISAWGWTDELSRSGKIGYDGTGGIFPRFTTVEENVVLDVGLYQKQSAAFFQAKSMQTTLKRNVFGSGPRAGILINDGFGGGNVLEHNLLFSFCRESSDHGPFNSWDRQLYVVRSPDDDGQPSFVPLTSVLRANLVIANYYSTLAIDHDDGSGWYNVTSNVVAYGSTGAKQDFGAHDLVHSNNLYAYLRGPCYIDYRGGEATRGHQNTFRGNVCIQGRKGQAYAAIGCNDNESIPRLAVNTVYTPDGHARVCNYTLQQWQKLGNDVKTKVIRGIPATEDILHMASQRLYISPSVEGQNQVVLS